MIYFFFSSTKNKVKKATHPESLDNATGIELDSSLFDVTPLLQLFDKGEVDYHTLPGMEALFDIKGLGSIIAGTDGNYYLFKFQLGSDTLLSTDSDLQGIMDAIIFGSSDDASQAQIENLMNTLGLK